MCVHVCDGHGNAYASRVDEADSAIDNTFFRARPNSCGADSQLLIVFRCSDWKQTRAELELYWAGMW